MKKYDPRSCFSFSSCTQTRAKERWRSPPAERKGPTSTKVSPRGPFGNQSPIQIGRQHLPFAKKPARTKQGCRLSPAGLCKTKPGRNPVMDSLRRRSHHGRQLSLKGRGFGRPIPPHDPREVLFPPGGQQRLGTDSAHGTTRDVEFRYEGRTPQEACFRGSPVN